MNSGNIKLSKALISVYDKTGLAPIVEKLHQLNVEILSTGGTKDFIEKMGIPVTQVDDITKFPEILGGRVKTLHPAVFGGILARRELPTDLQQVNHHKIPLINLVIVDLYPFEETIKKTTDESEIIEKIDIGGISLIRAAAKNHKDVLIIPSVNQYDDLLQILNSQNGEITPDQRKRMATLAFGVSSHYDSAIFNHFNKNEQIHSIKISENRAKTLRYGENPHQKGVFFGNLDEVFTQLNGKEISYNNLLDIDAAIHLISEFQDTAFAILKHNNACGLSVRPTLLEAYKDALAGDPVSAFGGVLIANRAIDSATAEAMNKLFFEVILAPDYDANALEILKSKPNRIILKTHKVELPKVQIRTLLNGFVMQDKDESVQTKSNVNIASKQAPSEHELEDLLFANAIVKHTKSNAIVLAKNKQLMGIGTGHTSRVDALKHAINKAGEFGLSLDGAVMASDAFFPFPDCVEIAHLAGIKAVIHPGGSIKDKDSIDYCDAHGLKMAITGIRHFKH